MGINKNFDDYDMRDTFSIPVYVGYDLVEHANIKGIDSKERVAGQIVRENRKTYLELADFPVKKNYVSPNSNGFIMNDDDKITNQDDGGKWYACTWNGDLQFVIRKYFRVSASTHMANNHFSEPTSKWLLSDYSITSQLMLSDDVKYVMLSMDHVYAWFNIFRPEQDLSKTDSLNFKNLAFESQKFSLVIGASGNEKHNLHVFQKTAYMNIIIEFEKGQTREFTYHLAVVIRNFFQILVGKSIGISQIILNKNQSVTPGKQKIIPKDERENWFLDQSFLPDTVTETNANFAVSYCDIEENFCTILTQYLGSSKLQRFVANFLTVDHFRTPVETQIITLVSAVESYYKDAKYSNGKKVKKAIEKLRRMGDLIEEPDRIVKGSSYGNVLNANSLFEEMVNARDYVAHGVKSEEYTSEAELVPDLIIFKNIICEAIIRVVLMQTDANNK